MASWANRAAQTNTALFNNQKDLANLLSQQSGGRASQMYGVLEPQVESLINSPGFDPATLSAITNATVGGAMTPYNEAATETNNQVARTGNRAGITAAQDQLAMGKAEAGSKAANQVQIENQQQKNLEQGLGLNLGQSLYGTNANQQLSALNTGTNALQGANEAINLQNQASGPSWLEALTGIGGMLTGGAQMGLKAAGIGGK